MVSDRWDQESCVNVAITASYIIVITSLLGSYLCIFVWLVYLLCNIVTSAMPVVLYR